MATEAQLQKDLQSAMKARAKDKVYVLRDVITAIKNLKVERQRAEPTEADITALVRKEINKRAEAADFARKANRLDLIQKNEGEKAILEARVRHTRGAMGKRSVCPAFPRISTHF